MTMNEIIFTTGIDVLITLLAISLAICFVRLSLGPDVPNRAVAFDLSSVNAVCIFVLFAVRSRNFVLLEGATVTAVLGFLGTMMFARYLERSRSIEEQRPSPRGDGAPISGD